jgi:3-hydroxyisobutyrate dehydrogenase-like beta-hydroxyacid dehydrogenase
MWFCTRRACLSFSSLHFPTIWTFTGPFGGMISPMVWLWNRTVRPEPNFLSGPAEIAEAARHIQIFGSNGEAMHSVLRAMLPALTPEHIILNHATVSPKDTLTAAGIVAEKHATFLDAPFTGSRDAAAATSTVMV